MSNNPRGANLKNVIRGVNHAYNAKTAGYYINRYADVGSLLKKNKMAPIRKKQRTGPRQQKQIKQAPNKKTPAQTKAASLHKGKTTNHKKKKNVKLPKGFKAKVAKALEPGEINGTWKQVSYDTLPVTSFATNQQIVSGLGDLLDQDYSDWAFDPEDFLHAASVLWNDKPDSQNNRIWNNTSNLGYSPEIVAPSFVSEVLPINAGAINPFFMNQKIHVKKAHETYKLKNNTQRTITLKIYLCAPKQSGVKSIGVVSDSLTPGNFPQYIGNPGQLWESSLKSQAFSHINVGRSVPQDLYQNPKSNPLFNKHYKSDCTIVVLEPGQVYDYFIQGPTNLDIEYKNLFMSGGPAHERWYQGIQKWMRYPLITAYLDMITDGDRSGRYPPSEAAGGTEAIGIERIMKFSLKMPESVGARVGSNGDPVAGQVELNSRRDCYWHKVYTPAGPTGDLNRVDVENPAIIIDEN